MNAGRLIHTLRLGFAVLVKVNIYLVSGSHRHLFGPKAAHTDTYSSYTQLTQIRITQSCVQLFMRH